MALATGKEQSVKSNIWLAAEGGYSDKVKSLCTSDPRLRQRDPKATTQKTPWEDSGVRVVTLDMEPDGSFGKALEFRHPEKLDVHLSKFSSAPGKRSVYILEGIGPGFTSILGDHFSIHPSFFLEHERVIVMNRKAQGESDGLALPSMLETREHVSLRYFEPLQFDKTPESFRLVCASTGRHIGVQRSDGEFLDVGIIRRKCGMWVRREQQGDGWDCLVICDPPVTKVRTGTEYSEEYSVKTSPYQGGYVDFTPQTAQMRLRKSSRPGPPRTCMLDDLVFYLQCHGTSVLASTNCEPDRMLLSDPDAVVGTWVRKIIASQYHKHAEHLRATLSAAQRALSRKHDLAEFPMEKVEELWSDVQAWERRMGEYCEDLESIMLQLGIPFKHPITAVSGYHARDTTVRGTGLSSIEIPPSPLASPSPSPYSMSRVPTMTVGMGGGIEDMTKANRWLDSTADFQFLLMRFRELRHRTECLNAAVTGLAGITGNRQAYKEQQLALSTARRSIREAKSSKAVTLLGLIFIPLAYTSSVFSMTEPYGPGGEQFWQYFAASLPLFLVVLAAYYVLDFGYTDDGTAWSMQTFLKTMRKKMEKRRPQEIIIEAKRPDSP